MEDQIRTRKDHFLIFLIFLSPDWDQNQNVKPGRITQDTFYWQKQLYFYRDTTEPSLEKILQISPIAECKASREMSSLKKYLKYYYVRAFIVCWNCSNWIISRKFYKIRNLEDSALDFRCPLIRKQNKTTSHILYLSLMLEHYNLFNLKEPNTETV